MVVHRFFLLPALFILFSCSAGREEITVTSGVGRLPTKRDLEVAPVVGSWEVYLDQVVIPGSQEQPQDPSYQHVPPVHGRYYTREDDRFVEGPITYRLTLTSVPATPVLGMHVPPSSGETTAWVNGEAADPLRYHSVIPLYPNNSETVDLTVLTKGHHYPRQGLTFSPARIGPLEELLRETSRGLFWDGLLVGVLLILAAYHFLLRLGQSPTVSRNVPTVTLSAFLLLLALRILLLEGTMLLSSVQWLEPAVYLRLRGIVVYPLLALYLRYLVHMFPGESPRMVMRVLGRTSWGWLLLSLIIPARWWMDLLFVWIPVLVAAVGSAVVLLLRACRAGRTSAHLLVVATIVLMTGIAVEVIRCMNWIPAAITSIPITLVLFGGFSSLALSRRVFDARISLANLREQAHHDGLTGLNNRRTLDSKLEEEWSRHMRSGISLAAIMIDIDHFKPYNDTLGHQAGDRVLQEVARTLQEHAQRATDVAARYGGEEFFLLLPNTTAANAYLLAERIRAAMHAKAIPHPTFETGIVTLSIGVTATIPEGDEHGPRGAASLIEAADRALYDAKRGGRDAVRVGTNDQITSDHR